MATKAEMEKMMEEMSDLMSEQKKLIDILLKKEGSAAKNVNPAAKPAKPARKPYTFTKDKAPTYRVALKKPTVHIYEGYEIVNLPFGEKGYPISKGLKKMMSILANEERLKELFETDEELLVSTMISQRDISFMKLIFENRELIEMISKDAKAGCFTL